MLIRASVLDCIVEGRVTSAFRWWRRPSVRAGTMMRTARGLVRIEAVEAVEAGEVTDEDVRRAGLTSREEALLRPAGREGATLYRIRLSYAGPDPRVALREQAALSDEEVAELSRRLDRLDRASTRGPWTEATLRLIAERPATLAADLAAEFGADKPWFKRNVRKLKELGLTESLERGYRLSPRGEALLAQVTGAGSGASPIDAVRAYCLSRPSADEGHPFGPGALVMKVEGRIFAIIGEDDRPATVSLKCDPEEAPLLRQQYAAVQPGYHLDKRHWNTVTLDGTVALEVVRGWIEDSYDLVVEKLPRRVREQLAGDA